MCVFTALFVSQQQSLLLKIFIQTTTYTKIHFIGNNGCWSLCFLCGSLSLCLSDCLHKLNTFLSCCHLEDTWIALPKFPYIFWKWLRLKKKKHLCFFLIKVLRMIYTIVYIIETYVRVCVCSSLRAKSPRTRCAQVLGWYITTDVCVHISLDIQSLLLKFTP